MQSIGVTGYPVNASDSIYCINANKKKMKTFEPLRTQEILSFAPRFSWKRSNPFLGNSTQFFTLAHQQYSVSAVSGQRTGCYGKIP